MKLPVLSNSFPASMTARDDNERRLWGTAWQNHFFFFFFVKDSSHKILCPLYFLSGLVIHLYAALFRHRKLREVTPPGMRGKRRRRRREWNIKDGGTAWCRLRKKECLPGTWFQDGRLAFLWSGTGMSHIRGKYHVGKIVCDEYRVGQTWRRWATTGRYQRWKGKG